MHLMDPIKIEPRSHSDQQTQMREVIQVREVWTMFEEAALGVWYDSSNKNTSHLLNAL
jgi:hypothetical protein